MVPIHSLDSIQKEFEQTLGISVQKVRKRVPIYRMGLIIGGRPPAPIYESKIVEERIEQWSKLVGVLFCPPSSKPGKEEVLPNLEYFHHRSALFVDFFCVGYGEYQPEEGEGAPPLPVAIVKKVPWLFSPKEFDNTRRELEAKTQWRYSGETDLLLAVVRKMDGQPAKIDFSSAISCNLEQMLRDGAITSVRSFLEKICQFGERYKNTDPVWKLSDEMGVEVGGSLLMETILSIVPEATRKAYKSASHFAIRDVSR